MKSDIGGLNEEAVERTFERMRGDVEACFGKGFARLPALGGHFQMRLRIAGDGAVRWAYMSESTLGDRDTERCLLDAARARTWPLPVGGDGLAAKAFDIEPQTAPKPVEPAKFQRAIKLALRETAKCRKAGVRGAFAVTVYLAGNGRVLSAGVAPPSEKGEATADCMAKELSKLRFGPAGAKVAKLSFSL
jgi:hypothetical protein